MSKFAKMVALTVFLVLLSYWFANITVSSWWGIACLLSGLGAAFIGMAAYSEWENIR